MKSRNGGTVDRFMVHLKNGGFEPRDAPALLRRARELCRGRGATIRDARVSSRYIEYDISVRREQVETLAAMLAPVGPLDHARFLVDAEAGKEQAVADGIAYFNAERFWEAHEALEGAWKQSYEGERDLLQGIILVAAAFVHYQKNEDRICVSIMGRALEKISGAGGTYLGIDVDGLRDRAAAIRDSGDIATFEI